MSPVAMTVEEVAEPMLQVKEWAPGIPVCWVNVFVAVQAYKTPVLAASVLKKSWPTEQVPGRDVPDLIGAVEVAEVESTGPLEVSPPVTAWA